MYANYKQMKNSREPFFELLENNNVVLYIDFLVFIDENGYTRYLKYVSDKLKKIDLSIMVLDLSDEDLILLTKERFKYESTSYQFNMMLENNAIQKKFIKVEDYEKRFKENRIS